MKMVTNCEGRVKENGKEKEGENKKRKRRKWKIGGKE